MNLHNNLGLTAPEQTMFSEISAILRKYSADVREFGICLIHSHFPLKKEEILHEVNNKATREMTVRPILKNQIPSGAHPTAWSISLDTGKPQVLQLCCD